MTVKEILSQIEQYEPEFMGQKLGDAGHIVVGFEVLRNHDGEFVVNLLGQSDTSGSPVVKKPFQDWLKDRR